MELEVFLCTQNKVQNGQTAIVLKQSLQGSTPSRIMQDFRGKEKEERKGTLEEVNSSKPKLL